MPALEIKFKLSTLALKAEIIFCWRVEREKSEPSGPAAWRERANCNARVLFIFSDPSVKVTGAKYPRLLSG